MRFLLVLALLAIIGVYCTNAHSFETNLERPPLASNEVDSQEEEYEDETDDDLSAPCEYRPCKRIYDPVCGLIDGYRITAPSLCEFNNRARCSKAMLNPDQVLLATVFMYRGPCRKADPKG